MLGTEQVKNMKYFTIKICGFKLTHIKPAIHSVTYMH